LKAAAWLLFFAPVQVSRLDEEKERLMVRASQFQSSCMALAAQLKETRDHWQTICATNANLQRELLALRSELPEWQVWLTPLAG
jgi:predicted  nucleic acid-binding Zn-ribbon protein